MRKIRNFVKKKKEYVIVQSHLRIMYNSNLILYRMNYNNIMKCKAINTLFVYLKS